MAKKQLFRGTVEALMMEDGKTISEMSFYLDQPVHFIKREIDRIKQCGPFNDWITYNSGSMEYTFVDMIKNCPIDSVIGLIKYFYNLNKGSMDMKMDLVKKNKSTSGGALHFSSVDYTLIDKFLDSAKPQDDEQHIIISMLEESLSGKNYFDFSTIKI